MWSEIKKLFAICVNPLIFVLIGVNVTVGFFIFRHFAIPSIAYAYTVVIMMIRYDSSRHTSKKIDWYDKIDFSQPKWQFKMGRLFILFLIISVIYYGLLWVVNL